MARELFIQLKKLMFPKITIVLSQVMGKLLIMQKIIQSTITLLPTLIKA